MKILHVYKCAQPFSTGGIEHVIDETVRQNHLRGHQNTILCLHQQGKAVIRHSTPHAELIAYPQTFSVASCGFSLQLLMAFRRNASEHDLIHFQFPWPFADVLAELTDKPYIVSYQSDIVRQKNWLRLYMPLMRRFLSGADRVTVSSPGLSASSQTLKALNPQPVLIPNGIEATPPVVDQALRAHYQHRFGRQFMLFVGAFRYYKGIEVLLEAAEKIKIPIVICGTGPLRDKISTLVKEKQLAHVHLLGFVEESHKNALIAECTALVLPSLYRSEAYGMVLVEAARLGKPMISTELSTGTSYINQHQQTGLVTSPRDANALATAMQTLLDNPDMAEALGLAARQRFEQLFTANKMGEALDALYHNVWHLHTRL